MKMKFLLSSYCAFSLLAMLLFQGCQSYKIVQRNVFVDDDGNILFVDYGRSEKNHENEFISPTTGETLPFKSKLMVKVRFDAEVPDYLELVDTNVGMRTNCIERGDCSFKAWQCMNTLSQGTMYASDDGEWKVLANGFSCVIYHQTEEEPPRYLEVFRGVVCDTQQIDGEKDDRWYDVRVHGREYKHKRPPAKK